MKNEGFCCRAKTHELNQRLKIASS